MKRLEEMTGNKYFERAAVILLLAAGLALRVCAIGSLPYGLNQDEASAGYDAWAILNYGVDRCGNAMPLLLEAWGSGQNVLLSYLAMPFIAVLGLSEFSLRLPMALAGGMALVFFWLTARRAGGPRFGLCALLFLALNPWHIMSCRWALESNLLPAFLMGGIYFTTRAKERPWSLLPASAFFGLSLYAYGTAFFFLPVFLVLAVIWLRKELRPASFIASLALFLALAAPIALCQIRNALGLPSMNLLGFTLPALTESRQAATTVFGGGGLRSALENFAALLKILLLQTDGLPYNSGGSGGLYYFFGLPLALLGLYRAFKTRGQGRRDAPVAFALAAALLAGFFIDVNINRVNMLWLPLIYFAALGLDYALSKMGAAAPIAFAGLILCFGIFFHSYRVDFGGEGYSGYFPGLGEAIEYVEAREPESAFVSYYINQPYIFVLFYTETPPLDFAESADYLNPDGAFRWVGSFGHWNFGRAEEAEGDYLILHSSEAAGHTVLETFGDYVVCAG